MKTTEANRIYCRRWRKKNREAYNAYLRLYRKRRKNGMDRARA